MCLCVHLHFKSVHGLTLHMSADTPAPLCAVCIVCCWTLSAMRLTNCTVCCFTCVFSVGLIKWIMPHSWQSGWRPHSFWQSLPWVSRIAESSVCLQPLLLSAVTATCCATCWVLLDRESHRTSFTWQLFQWITYTSKNWHILSKGILNHGWTSACKNRKKNTALYVLLLVLINKRFSLEVPLVAVLSHH